MTDGPARLLSELRARSLDARRVGLDELWRAFHAAFPHLRGAPEARRELRELLERLIAASALSLPRSPGLFDRAQEPPLPRWIELPSEARGERAGARAARIAWHPALDFARTLPRLTDAELEQLLAVQRFLVEQPATGPLLSVRERSLRIFADEKRIDGLLAGRLFEAGRLSLSLLRCRRAHLPFAHRAFPGGRAALIIENKDTFWSACAARASLAASEVGWIIFGGGNAISRSFPSLLEWPARPARLLYFGDLDRRGIEIAVSLRAQAQALGDLPPLECAAPLYERLIEAAAVAGAAQCGAHELAEIDRELVGWLPPSLRSHAIAAVAGGARWVQEWVTERDFVELLSGGAAAPLKDSDAPSP